MPAICFIDVDPTERPFIMAQYPDATFIEPDIPEAELMKFCNNAEILSTFVTTTFTPSLLKKLPALRFISTRSVGVDHIDLAACEEHGITVCNVPDYGSHVIAEHVFALLLSTFRHIDEAKNRMRAGDLSWRGLRGMSLRGKTLGIVGTGRIGHHVAHIGAGFGMRLLAYDLMPASDLHTVGLSYVSLEELLRESDIVSLHIPGGGEKPLLCAKELSTLKKGVVLVNTARGSLIDGQALMRELKSDRLAYVLLDVLPQLEASLQQELLSHPKVIATPHIAFYAEDSAKRMVEESLKSINEWRAGNVPSHRVLPRS